MKEPQTIDELLEGEIVDVINVEKTKIEKIDQIKARVRMNG